jgi:ferric-dicitrate binding protein FerR (iron transport regulator)
VPERRKEAEVAEAGAAPERRKEAGAAAVAAGAALVVVVVVVDPLRCEANVDPRGCKERTDF